MNFPKRENLTAYSNKLIVVGSANPVKIKSAEEAFNLAFDHPFHVTGINVPSGVSDQPMNAEETWEGARNRARNAKKAFPEADYWVGIEGGVDEDEHGLFAFAWIYIEDKNGKSGQAQTGTFYLPAPIADLVKQGVELGKADDQFFSQENSKQQGGSVGILTKGKLDRKNYYSQAVLLALIPFVQKDLYK
ncbi:non-canonical purine NTP phosphatase [Algoriphagus kandeliae]|uniref:Probable inosine/xanthosine triphosphatase n=1 Tax=Algoriphagus kandeliae TaxID=2562278 RepID=A0A4Y9QY61_9BACT|nr:inosine/xanthosine triphosphatase [Algoriphagus kandeliae]TFV95965.1 non-canonical purine NTP phosphatase [Algoriphagus kandeliae]